MVRMISPYWYAASIIMGMVTIVQGLALGDGIESLLGGTLMIAGAIYLIRRLSASGEEG